MVASTRRAYGATEHLNGVSVATAAPHIEEVPAEPERRERSVADNPGQVFMDLLLLGALACQAPLAVLSVPQPDGRWNTLAYGADTRDGLADGQLFELFSRSGEPVEVSDLVTAVPRSPMIQPPHSLRWAYGVALRDETGRVVGVVAVMDRWLRQLTKAEQRAVAAMARQLSPPLGGLRRTGNGPGEARTNGAAPMPRDGWADQTPAGLDHASSQPALTGPAAEASRLETAAGAAIARSQPGRRSRTSSASSSSPGERHPLLRSQEVAELFDVTERTVINWAAAGKLPCLRTIGGHLRFRREDVHRLLAGSES
jgi:excisionase family DNA binding protein